MEECSIDSVWSRLESDSLWWGNNGRVCERWQYMWAIDRRVGRVPMLPPVLLPSLLHWQGAFASHAPPLTWQGALGSSLIQLEGMVEWLLDCEVVQGEGPCRLHKGPLKFTAYMCCLPHSLLLTHATNQHSTVPPGCNNSCSAENRNATNRRQGLE